MPTIELASISTTILLQELAKRCALHGSRKPPESEIEALKRIVAQSWKIPVENLDLPSRRMSVVLPRSQAMVLMRWHGLSWHEIGEAFRMDHGTAIHAVNNHDLRYSQDKRYINTFNKCRFAYEEWKETL